MARSKKVSKVAKSLSQVQGILGLISYVPFPGIHISTRLLEGWKCALDNKEYVDAILSC